MYINILYLNFGEYKMKISNYTKIIFLSAISVVGLSVNGFCFQDNGLDVKNNYQIGNQESLKNEPLDIFEVDSDEQCQFQCQINSECDSYEVVGRLCYLYERDYRDEGIQKR